MERKLKAFQKQHAAWKKATKKATDDLWAEWEREEAQKRREAEEAAARRAEREREEAQKRREAEEAAARRARAAERSEVQRYANEIVRGELREDSGGWSLSNQGQDQYNPPSYCEWSVDGERKRLIRGFWYPCYHLDTHQWGKARVYMGCISFINRNMGICNLRTADAIHECQIGCRNSEVDPQYNFQLGLSFGSNEANLLGWYEIGKIVLEKITRRSEYQSVYEPDVFRPFLQAVNENAAGLHDNILSEILRPWPKKSLTRGYRADKFFPNVGQSVYTQLRILRDREILVFWS